MSESRSNTTPAIVHTEVMDIRATPETIREFILTPDRILDYFPSGIDGGVLEAGKAIYCRGEIGTSMLELLEDESDDALVVIKVTTALDLEAPFTRERIEANYSFTMIEDWALAATDSGTRLTKTWRDIGVEGEEPFPLAEAIREGGIHESPRLVAGWDKAAEGQA
ncbi:MAG: hypothetical protein GY910_02050 [bacterium]|nr:hypothetical protein [Deltaproteobacteria bacterium]MCP4903736.1 hypothetical protein [bacterium]